jgi:hypothetical protein
MRSKCSVPPLTVGAYYIFGVDNLSFVLLPITQMPDYYLRMRFAEL